MTGFFYTTCTDCNSLRLHTVEPLSDITTNPNTVTIKRSEVEKIIDFVINGCDARPEDKHDALSILETALGEKK